METHGSTGISAQLRALRNSWAWPVGRRKNSCGAHTAILRLTLGRAHGETILTDGRRAIGRHGPHSVFWIPMEIIGILAIVGGLVLAGATLAGALVA